MVKSSEDTRDGFFQESVLAFDSPKDELSQGAGHVDTSPDNPFFQKSIKKFESWVFSDVSEEGNSKKRRDKTWLTS